MSQKHNEEEIKAEASPTVTTEGSKETIKERIVLLGAGNLATHLSLSLQQAGYQITQLFSRTEASAKILAEQLGCGWTTQVSRLMGDADLYLFALKDDALESILSQMSPNDGLWIHTSGSLPQTIFAPYASRYGVLYPLQTFSKERQINFKQIPCFVEANRVTDELLLSTIVKQISTKVMRLSSEKRQYLHLAAVFACNFTNHLYYQADKILKAEGLSFNLLLPLIEETANKVVSISPKEAQTGPAIRYDQRIIKQQMALITDDDTREIYHLISKNIHKEQTNEQH